MALQFPELPVSFVFFCDILRDGDVYDRASGSTRREEERRELDEVSTFPQKNLVETADVRIERRYEV